MIEYPATSLVASTSCGGNPDRVVYHSLQAAFHAIASGKYVPSHRAAPSNHSYEGFTRARQEASPVKNVHGLMFACVAIGTVLYGVVCWWWSSGVSDGTKQHDMTQMTQQERYYFLASS